MFKTIGLFLLSSLIAPLISANNVVYKEAEPDDSTVLHGYTYTDVGDYGYNMILREFDSKELTPKINKHFKAPSGYVFTLSIEEEQLNEIFDQAEFVGADFFYSDTIIYYSYLGSTIYTDSMPLYIDSSSADPREEAYTRIKGYIDDFVLLEVDEVVVESEIALVIEFQFYSRDDSLSDYTFRFLGDPLSFVPFDGTDFIDINAFYYEQSYGDELGEKRVTIYAEPISGFFYESEEYNKYGFLTDTTSSTYDSIKGDEAWKCDYEMTLLAFDTIPMGDLGRYGSIEMSYPSETLELKAKMKFVSGGETYTYYSKSITVADPRLSLAIDGYLDRNTIQRGSEHLFSININGLEKEDITQSFVYVNAFPYRLADEESGYDLFDDPSLPATGEEGKYYYIPSEEEIELHKQGRDEEFINNPAGGRYYFYDKENAQFEEYQGINIIDNHYNPYDDESDEEASLESISSLPYIGKWAIHCQAFVDNGFASYGIQKEGRLIDVVVSGPTKDKIILSCPDEINFLVGTGEYKITPSIQSESQEEVTYYYDWSSSREGIVDIEENADGTAILTPRSFGVTELTITVECRLFSKISKTISVRVLDSIYGVAKIYVPDEFHYAGNDLTAEIDIRGFRRFQNLNIEWKLLDKENNELSEDRYLINGDATITLAKAKQDDYSITAFYEGIELETINVSVRKININEFIRTNIWWIVLLTAIFVFVVLLLRRLLSRGLTTVQSIGKVYDVYCNCIADDKLTKSELQTIRKEINKCVHRCEDLNIEALNQYEKAIRYLRKSASDCTNLLKKWDDTSIEDRSALIEKLNLDLSKALNVAKEIENAKSLVEEYHAKANKSNYETIKEEKSKGKKKEN